MSRNIHIDFWEHEKESMWNLLKPDKWCLYSDSLNSWRNVKARKRLIYFIWMLTLRYRNIFTDIKFIWKNQDTLPRVLWFKEARRKERGIVWTICVLLPSLTPNWNLVFPSNILLLLAKYILDISDGCVTWNKPTFQGGRVYGCFMNLKELK